MWNCENLESHLLWSIWRYTNPAIIWKAWIQLWNISRHQTCPEEVKMFNFLVAQLKDSIPLISKSDIGYNTLIFFLGFKVTIFPHQNCCLLHFTTLTTLSNLYKSKSSLLCLSLISSHRTLPQIRLSLFQSLISVHLSLRQPRLVSLFALVLFHPAIFLHVISSSLYTDDFSAFCSLSRNIHFVQEPQCQSHHRKKKLFFEVKFYNYVHFSIILIITGSS